MTERPLAPGSSFEDVYLALQEKSRAEANQWLEANVGILKGPEWDKYRQARLAEIFHVRHVRRVMREADLPPGNPGGEGHDHTKDEWFWFVSIGRFTMGLKDLTRAACREAFDEHYKAEPHHEEYETLNGVECPPDAIAEMAVDRLSRNLQFNGGEYNMEQINLKYEPKFRLGDTEQKLELYRSQVQKLRTLTKEVWQKMKEQVNGAG